MKDNIKLNILNTSSSIATHVAVCVNSEKDNGVLYFTETEWDVFRNAIQMSPTVHVEVEDERHVTYDEEYDY